MQLSPHFSLAELTVTNTGLRNVPTVAQVANLRFLASKLEEVRALFTGPLFVNSAFRCDGVNKKVGGAATSAHLDGLAADIRHGDFTPLEICRRIVASKISFDQVIFEGTWCHFGVRYIHPRRQVLTTIRVGRRTNYRVGL